MLKVTQNINSKFTALFLISLLLLAFHFNYARIKKSVVECIEEKVLIESHEQSRTHNAESGLLQVIELSGIPKDTFVSCNADVVNVSGLNITGTTTPGCGPVNITFSRVVPAADSICINKKTILHIWTATDNCGNICRDTQKVTVDNIRLVTLIQLGVMDTFSCTNDFLSIYNANVNLSGNCGIIEQNYVLNFIVRGCANKRDYTFTWFVRDECNNIFQGSQMIFIRDTIKPTLINVPADLTVQCPDDVPNPSPTVGATDNCVVNALSPISISFTKVVTDSICPGNKVINYIWTATDACSNTVRDTQKITVSNTVPPLIKTVPPDLTVNCACDVPPVDSTIFAVDNCGFVELQFQREVYDSVCINNKKIRNIWIAKSNCNIITRDTQNIVVIDNTKPTLQNVPGNVLVNCADDVPPPSSLVTSNDNCSNSSCSPLPIISVERIILDSLCLNNKTIKYRWTATDNCGNVSRDSQIISVRDLISPSLVGVPANITVSCAENVPSPASPSATDNCSSGATISFSRSLVDSSCVNNKTIKYRWTATDNCGNVSRDSQIISVRDTVPPIVNKGRPHTVQLACRAEIPNIRSVYDLFSLGLEVEEMCCLDSFAIELIDETSIEINDTTFITRTYKIEDCCDNISEVRIIYKRFDTCEVDLSIKKAIIGPTPYIVGPDMTINFKVTVKNDFGIPVDSIKLVDYLPSIGTVITTSGWVNNGNGKACYTLSVQNGLLPSGGLKAGDSIMIQYSMRLDNEAMKPIVYNFIEIQKAKSLNGKSVQDIDSTPDDIFSNDRRVPSAIDEDPKFLEDDISGVVFFNCKALECNSLVNISLDASCEAIVDITILNGLFKDLPYRLELYDEKGNLIPGNKLTKEHIGQKIKASVIGLSVCGSNSCWGYLIVEDKLPPILHTPKDTVVYCLHGLTPDKTGQAKADDCSDVKIGFRDIKVIKKEKCERDPDTLQIIHRLWSAMDKQGMMVSDTQSITVLSIPDSLIKGPTTTLLLNCGDSVHPDSIMKYLSTKDAYPYFVNPTTKDTVKLSIGESCNLASSYIDGPRTNLCGEFCGGSYKMIRTWTILNWCTGKSRRIHQIIKVEDKKPPVVEVTEPTTAFNVNAWKCGMDLDLPLGIAIDECDPAPRIVKIEAPLGVRIERVGNRWRAYDVPKGITIFKYFATDCCGNTGETQIAIRVEDRVPPVPVAKEFITVSLTANNDSLVTGIAKLRVENIDNGSNDNCSPILLEIRRDDDAPACLNIGKNGHNNNRTYNARLNAKLQQVPLHPHDHVNDTDLGQEVKFCCEDIGKEVKVFLRVWDDGDMDGVFGSAGDNYNETWTMVKVEDKSLPHLSCKPIIITTCNSDSARVYPAKGWLDVEQRVPSSLWPTISSVCPKGSSLEFRDEGTVTQCNTTPPQQPIRRTYRIKGTNVVCLQEITLLDKASNPELDYPIELMKWNRCTLTEEDVIANTWRAKPKSALPEKGYGTEIDLDANGKPLLFRPDYRNTGCAIYGRQIKIDEYQTNDGCKKWLVRFNYINWCDVQETDFREVTYKFEDKTPPQITDIKQRDTVDVDPIRCLASWTVRPSGNDTDNACQGGLDWKVILTNDTLRIQQNGKGTNPVLSFSHLQAGRYKVSYTLSDACSNLTTKEGELWVRGKKPTPYCISLTSAVMKDGTVELWAKDFDKGSFANCNNKVLFYTFDEAHPVLSKLKKTHFFRGKGIEVTGPDTTILYRAGEIQKWVPVISVRQRPTLPGGTQDPRGPDTTLIGGSSARLFGCKVGNGSTFPRAQIKMTVWDDELNSDFCTVDLYLIDNMGDCSGHSLLRIAGTVSSIHSEGVSNVQVELRAQLPEYPVKTTTDTKGQYLFEGLPVGAKYEIKPSKNGDYLNGVNTLDLVQMQRHILGIQKLQNPYLLIAADADGDQAVRVNDIVEIRKLILGISENLPSSDSWKMVRKNAFIEHTPWPFDEVITHAVLSENSLDNDFTAVKIGDVDGNAIANGATHMTEPRSVGVQLSIEDKILHSGDETEVVIIADDFKNVYGMQFTLLHHGLKILSVDGRGIDLDHNNTATPKKDMLTLSWAANQGITAPKGSALISLKCKALETVQLSKVLSMTGDITQKEAYIGPNMERSGISLHIRKSSPSLTAQLSQNEPNPWKYNTLIKYELPHQNEVIFKVTDLSGKVIFTKKLNGSQGINQFILDRSEMNNASGIMYYSLEVNDQILQKRMIVIE